MASIEDEIKKLRKGLLRSLVVVGIVTLGAIIFVAINHTNQNPSGMLADIGSAFQEETPATSDSIVPTSPESTPSEETTTIAMPEATTTAAMEPVATTTAAATTVEASTSMDTGTSAATTATEPAITAPPPEPEPVPAPTPTPAPAPIPAAQTATATPVTAAATTTPAIPPTLPYRASAFGANDGWRKWWGDFSEASGTLMIGADTSTTGGGALLDGTGGWDNYTFQAIVDWAKGNSFGLLARYTPDDDYVACEFNQPSPGVTHMYLDEYTNGQGVTLASADVPNYSQTGGSNISASITVQGNQGTCSFNGYSLSGGTGGKTLNFPAAGGIGFVSWDPDTNNSQIVVTSVSVSDN